MSFVHGIYRTAPYLFETAFVLFIHKTERDRGNPISMDDARSYFYELKALSKASQEKRNAARRKRKFKEAAKCQKQIWIQQDPISEHWGGGTIKWKNLGLDSRIDPKSLRGKYHRMPGKSRRETIAHIIQTEGGKLVRGAKLAGVDAEEIANKVHTTLKGNGIIKFHRQSGFWHGVDWNTASLENVHRATDELTKIQQGFRDKYGDLPKGFCDYLRPEESSWLKSIMDLDGCTLTEAINTDKALWGCSRDPRKLPVRRLEKHWRCGFNCGDQEIAEAKAAKISAEQVRWDESVRACRNMPKKFDAEAAIAWIEENISKTESGLIWYVARELNHIERNEAFDYFCGADALKKIAA